MSEMDNGIEVAGDNEARAAIEAEARSLGWADRSHWRGPADEFRDADEFLRRGREIVPFIRHNNEKLTGQLAAANAQIAALRGTVDQQSETVKNLIEHQAAEIKRQVEGKLKGLKADKITALKDGDHALAAALEEEIDLTKEEFETAQKAAVPKPADKTDTSPAVDPEISAFAEENKDWLNEDTKENRKSSKIFMALCEDLYRDGLRGRRLLEEGKKELQALTAPTKPKTAKSEGGGGGWGGSGSGGSSGDGTFFSDLPADAKAMAKKQEKQFVGPEGSGKAFKTADAWHKHYAETYFASAKR